MRPLVGRAVPSSARPNVSDLEMRWPSWTVHALCRGMDLATFYQEGEGWAAKRICAECPVRQDCLAYAFEIEDGGVPYGIFGGATADERAIFTDAPDRLRAVTQLLRRQLIAVSLITAEEADEWGLSR